MNCKCTDDLYCDECYDPDYDEHNTAQEIEHYLMLAQIDQEREERQYYIDNPVLCPHWCADYEYCDICDRED